ncbi:hypothetical protein D5S18_29580 [Nocardia panacis]|uniref:Uncharacterized protein n=1 Tax=Nocardia panacis TaxID=2340916 RepID=A0A3A4JZF2_9NOCA|nr:hypothetical protein [Nocardia panacis]RJO70016.1 hypothetical protein D5S18_29580 [Nocardia panacis]
MTDDPRKLARALESAYPGTASEVDQLPNGGFYLTVRRGDRTWVMDRVRGRFGVDELRPDDGGLDTAYRFTTDEFAVAAAELHRLISEG